MRGFAAWFSASVVLFVSCANDTPADVGKPCTVDVGCAAGLCFRAEVTPSGTVWRNGYCSADCSHTDCEEGKCLELGDGQWFCVAECADDRDCRKGYVCAQEVGVCLPDCRLGWWCGEALACSEKTGQCTVSTPVELGGESGAVQSGSPGTGGVSEQPALPPEPVGSACELNAQCETNLCIPEMLEGQSTGWPLGYCSQTCSEASCPAGSTCVTFDDGSAYCAATCEQSSDCREKYACSMPLGFCLPNCREGWSCGTRFVCDEATGTCVLPPTSEPVSEQNVGKEFPSGDASTPTPREAGPLPSRDAGRSGQRPDAGRPF